MNAAGQARSKQNNTSVLVVADERRVEWARASSCVVVCARMALDVIHEVRTKADVEQLTNMGFSCKKVWNE